MNLKKLGKLVNLASFYVGKMDKKRCVSLRVARKTRLSKTKIKIKQ